MKINPGWRPFGKDIQRSDGSQSSNVQQKPFADLLHQHDQRATVDELNRIMDQIQRQSERLARSMTVRELRQYKLLIQRFLEETARRGVALRDTRGWDRRGRTKRYKLLEEVDAVLVSMADDMVESEQGRIEILHKIGEIRGMLINLLF